MLASISPHRFAPSLVTGAGLSAAGAMLSDLIFTAGRVRYVRTDKPDFCTIDETLRELEAEISAEIADLGAESPESDYWVEARYLQQTWEIEVPLPTPLKAGPSLIENIVNRFHDIYDKLYAVCDRKSPIEIIGWRARASCRLDGPTHARLRGMPSGSGRAKRKVYLPETGWTEAPVQPLQAIKDGGEIFGPAIVESPFTTIFIPKGRHAIGLASGSLKVELPQEKP